MVNLSDNSANPKNNLISLICDQASSLQIDYDGHFSDTFKTLVFYNYSQDSIENVISSWNSLTSEYIKSGAIADGIEKLIPATVLAHQNGAQLMQFLSILFSDFKRRYDSIILETIAYDKKMCAVLSAAIAEKMEALKNNIIKTLSPAAAKVKTAEEEKHENFRLSLEENLHSMLEDLRQYFPEAEISETLFKTDGGQDISIIRQRHLSPGFKISPSDAVNILKRFGGEDEVISFSARDVSYIAIKADYNFKTFDYAGRTAIVVLKINSDKPAARDLMFVKQAVKLLHAADEKIIAGIETLISAMKIEILKKTAMPHDAFENIDGFFRSILETLCSQSGAKYALFMCAGEMSKEDSLKTFGFSESHSSLIANRMIPLHSKLMKSIAGYLNGSGVKLVKNAAENLKQISTEFLSFSEYRIGDAMVMPLTQNEVLKGVIILFTENDRSFSVETEMAAGSVVDYIINALCNCMNCNRIKKENADFNARLEEAVSREKLKLLAAISTGIAHNFNNLMAVILGRVGLLQRQLTDEKALASLKVIETTLKNGEDIIKRLQAFIPKKSVNTGHLLTDMNKLIADVVEITKMRIQAESYLKNVTINATVNICRLPMIYINQDEIQEALLNISFNSIEAMPHGGDITIGAYIEESNVCISIKDTGIGMSKEIQQKAFTPFFTTKGQIGTGLSLSYTYGVILKHQGNIVIKSSVGKGTELIVKLPLAIESKDDETVLKTIRKLDYKSKVIILDDNEAIRTALCDIIKSLGHTPVTAKSGAEAFEILKKDDKYDFIFTDYKMPQISGAEVAKYIKANYPHIFVIMVTAFSYDLEEMDVESGVIDAIIGKPFNVVTIENTINAALNKKLKV
ncbi:MAG TPA: ATP-binding protein [Candidatus Wallbacteria bacterium]|nr:ATP-binding protein [Candidatus Wallbacteria bacterium]